ncbi:unnamed protein product [Dicrocoelium dendriticum]|nr:unnamed protein product [Dicrocoelium dendriticum]
MKIMPKTEVESKVSDDTESTVSESTVFGRMVSALLGLLNSVIYRGQVRVQAPPQPFPPEKFCIGDDYEQWERQARWYVDRFPENERAAALSSLLSNDAYHIAASKDIIGDVVNGTTFAQLKEALQPSLHEWEYGRQFHARVQRHGEQFTIFVAALRKLAILAYPHADKASREEKIFLQALQGTTNIDIKKDFLEKPPATLQEAVDSATRREKILAVIAREEPRRVSDYTELVSVVRPREQQRRGQRNFSDHRSTQWNNVPRFTKESPVGPQMDCPYCRRFGRFAYSCGHNRRGESQCLFKVPAVTFANAISAPVVSGFVWSKRVGMLIDTGATCSLVHIRVVPRGVSVHTDRSVSLIAANGSSINPVGWITATVSLGGISTSHRLLIVGTLPWDVILGVDFLFEHDARIDLVNKTLEIGKQIMSFDSTIACKSSCMVEDTPVQKLIRNVPPDIPSSALDKLKEILNTYQHAFAWTEGDLGRCSFMRHRIDTGNAPPIRQAARRVPVHFQEELKCMIEDMLRQDIIRPSNSPWASPIVLVKKKSGDLRLCVDYRKLNAITRKDSFPLPRIDDTMDALAGSHWFTTLDLASGYWQVELHPDDRCKSAFVVPSGLYEFQTMPFGLTNAPATFQRLMHTALSGMIPESCLVYLDDIIVHGRTVAEHNHNLSLVLNRLIQLGLKLKPSKCQFLKNEVAYLGHIVSGNGVRCDPEKVERVRSWPIPKNTDEVRSFLGLASYYRRFVKHFATIATPLNEILKANQAFTWGEAQQKAFECLRNSLCEAPVLAFPDTRLSAGPFILDTDASNTGIGAVLSQRTPDGKEPVIAYASRSLSQRERNYCATRKEMLALIFFIKQFRHYLLGRKFIVRTDHQSLVWLQNFRDPEGQIARWQEQLQEYDFECHHRPGIKHGNADALSRRPNRNHGSCPSCTAACVSAVIFDESETEEWVRMQSTDPELSILYSRIVQNGDRPTQQELAGASWETKCLWSLWPHLRVINGIMYFQNGPSYLRRIIVPTVATQEVMRRIHEELGHAGQNKMEAAIRRRFWWPHLRRDIAIYCQACPDCARIKNPTNPRRGPLQPMTAGFPNEIVGIDIIGPLPETARGHRHVLVMVDYFTKWCEVVPLRNVDAWSIAKAFLATGWQGGEHLTSYIRTEEQILRVY